MTICRVEDIKQQAEINYFELTKYFDNDNAMAKELQHYLGRSSKTIVRNLAIFAFRKRTTTQNFINASNIVLNKIKKEKIIATALLVVSETTSPIRLCELANDYVKMGINIISPQSWIYQDQEEQIWRHLELDVKMVDFIIMHDLSENELNLLNSINKEEQKKTIESSLKKDIEILSRKITLTKKKDKCHNQ